MLADYAPLMGPTLFDVELVVVYPVFLIVTSTLTVVPLSADLSVQVDFVAAEIVLPLRSHW